MDLSRPHSALSPSLDLDALKVLAGTSQPLTGRHVARLAGASQRGVATVLDRLVDQGIVFREEAGRALMYSLNRRHLVAPAVEILANLRPELVERLRDAFETWRPPPVHAALFGSAARGDGDVESDIDLFLVRPEGTGEDAQAWREQVSRLSDDVTAWTGNHAAIVELPEHEVESLFNEHSPLVEALRGDAIDLCGSPASKLSSAA